MIDRSHPSIMFQWKNQSFILPVIPRESMLLSESCRQRLTKDAGFCADP